MEVFQIGIHSITDSVASLFRLLVNDVELKTLMNIPINEQDDYSLLLEKYFIQTYISDTPVTDPICELLIRTAPQQEVQRNDAVKFENVVIEIFVHSSIDIAGIGGFRRRTHMIADRIIKLLHNQYVDSNLYKLADKNELQSGTPQFRRYFLRFQYKAIYT